MNLQNHGQPDQIGMVTDAAQLQGDHPIPYQLNQVMVPGNSQPSGSAPVLISYEEILHQQQLQLQQKLQNFWASQNNDVHRTTDFKKRLPLSRLKKAMKADRDVKMISSETPTVIAKACEMFIQELTLRSWCHTEANRRRRLQKSDILSAINGTETFDFLADIVNGDGPKDDILQTQIPAETRSIPATDVDSSRSSLLYDMLPPPPLPPQVGFRGTVIDTSAMEAMPVIEPSSGLRYNVAPPRHPPQAGTGRMAIDSSAMEPMPVMEPYSGLPYNVTPSRHRPQVGTGGVVTGNSAMEPMPVIEPFSGLPCNVPPSQPPPQVGTGRMVIGNSAVEPMPVMEPSYGLSYNIPPPQHPPQIGISGIVLANSAMGTIPVTTEFGPSSLHYQYAPQVCDTGIVPGKSAMDQPIHVQPSPAGTMAAMETSGLDPYNMQHHFPPQVGGTDEMVTGKSAADQPIYSEELHQDLAEQMWRMEELEELESTYIERVTLWR